MNRLPLPTVLSVVTATTPMTMTARIDGAGPVTAYALVDVLAAVPGDAHVDLRVTPATTDTEASTWSFVASWQEDPKGDPAEVTEFTGTVENMNCRCTLEPVLDTLHAQTYTGYDLSGPEANFAAREENRTPSTCRQRR